MRKRSTWVAWSMVAVYVACHVAGLPLSVANGNVQRRPGFLVALKTSNPIESTFAPVRARTRVTKGPGSQAAGLAMAFKLLEAAQGRWRAVNGPHLVALVRAGARFDKGVMVERPDEVDEVAA